MTPNPFEPPKAKLRDISQGEAAPLWNPNAAANWSLLFSPVFGALVHMKNWQALGESAKAASARVWAMVSLVGIVGAASASVLLPNITTLDPFSRLLGLSLLIGWYASSGRAQAAYVKSRFGNEYPRRGWGKPLLLAAASLAAFVGVLAVLAIIAAAVTHRI